MGKVKCEGLIAGFLIFFNVILCILSLIMITVGAFVLWNRQIFFVIIDMSGIGKLSDTVSIPQDNLHEIAAKLWQVLPPMSAFCLIIGLILFAATLLAFIGVGLANPKVLIAHAVIMGCLIVIHVLFVLVYFSNKPLILKDFKNLMVDTFNNYSSYDNSTTAYLTAMISQTWQCCGYNSGEDFKKSTKFNETLGDMKLEYPSVCCFANATGECPPTFLPNNSYVNRGCRYLVEEELTKITDYIANYSFIIMVLTVLSFILAVLIIVYTDVR